MDTSNITWRSTTTTVAKDDMDAMLIVEPSAGGWIHGQTGEEQGTVVWWQMVSLQRRASGVEKVHPSAAWIPFIVVNRGAPPSLHQDHIDGADQAVHSHPQ